MGQEGGFYSKEKKKESERASTPLVVPNKQENAPFPTCPAERNVCYTNWATYDVCQSPTGHSVPWLQLNINTTQFLVCLFCSQKTYIYIYIYIYIYVYTNADELNSFKSETQREKTVVYNKKKEESSRSFLRHCLYARVAFILSWSGWAYPCVRNNNNNRKKKALHTIRKLKPSLALLLSQVCAILPQQCSPLSESTVMKAVAHLRQSKTE